MCLAIPGRIERWIDRDPVMGRAVVDFDGLSREVQMACAPQAEVGDYVMVHAGMAIGIIDTDQAEATMADFRSLRQVMDGEQA